MKRPQLFTLMLAAFALVIVLGVGGMGVFFGLSAVFGGHSGPVDFLRGLVSAGLALAAVLLALAAFFSRRLSAPLRRLTEAARRLAAGDWNARVAGGGVRELHDLADAFNSMAASLARADQQRRQLTADVAHELRTPLSVMRGRLEGIQDGIYPATAEQMDLLLDEVALLERLIEDLRLLALADAGQLPLYPEPLDAAHLLHDAARALAPQAESQQVALDVQVAPDLPEVAADPQRIAQVLSNLVGNAVRHTPAGGQVTLHAWAAHPPGLVPALVIAVADTGSGIAPADLPHIFDRFWRADRARTRSSGGAGLGLAIARRIVEAHGGQIGAQSQPGHGTTVTFTLPLTPFVPLAPLAPPANGNGHANGHTRDTRVLAALGRQRDS
jgi:two-component system OmpR family sensor kinase/two-component system sensor histidine kinase BaeS